MTDVLFSELDLNPAIAKAVAEMGFDHATPVQAQAIPLIRGGADVIARSQTGTGKTAAFAIPVLEAIDTEARATVQALILCPTRELAQQAGEQVRKLAKYMTGINTAEVFGGADMERQFTQLKRANIVIGTPGRVLDHMRRGTLKLWHLKVFVLDEADEMLKMGFKEDIETIFEASPPERQTVLFSATMPPAILAMTKAFQKNPELVEIDKSLVTLEQISQSYVEVPTGMKMEALKVLLRRHQPQRAIIFCNTKHMVDDLSEFLGGAGVSAESIHGDMKQAQRTRVMNGFKQGKIAVLIATDVAARGIDVNDIDFVFNYDIPMKTEYYVHRIGRTGRAGKSGCAITLCCGKRQAMEIAQLAKLVKSVIRKEELPTASEIRSDDAARRAAKVELALAATPAEEYDTLLEALLEKEFTLEQIAKAALALAFPQEAIPETPVRFPKSVSSYGSDRQHNFGEKRGYGDKRSFGDKARSFGEKPRHSENPHSYSDMPRSYDKPRAKGTPAPKHEKPANPKAVLFAKERIARKEGAWKKDPTRHKSPAED